MISDAQCAGMLLTGLLMLVEVMACPRCGALHVAVGTVHPFVFLVDSWYSLLDPSHIFCCFIVRELAVALVHGALVVISLREEEIWISVGIAKISPSQSCLCRIDHAVLEGDLRRLLGSSLRERFCESGEGVSFPEKGADLRGSLGNFHGSAGNFRGSVGNFRGTLDCS